MPSYLFTQFISGVRCANGCRRANESACQGAALARRAKHRSRDSTRQRTTEQRPCGGAIGRQRKFIEYQFGG